MGSMCLLGTRRQREQSRFWGRNVPLQLLYFESNCGCCTHDDHTSCCCTAAAAGRCTWCISGFSYHQKNYYHYTSSGLWISIYGRQRLKLMMASSWSTSAAWQPTYTLPLYRLLAFAWLGHSLMLKMVIAPKTIDEFIKLRSTSTLALLIRMPI